MARTQMDRHAAGWDYPIRSAQVTRAYLEWAHWLAKGAAIGLGIVLVVALVVKNLPLVW